MIPILTVIITIIWYWHNIKKDKSAIEIVLYNELKSDKPNKHLVEKLFFDVYKCGKTSYEEIDILFNHPQSLEAIKEFTSRRRQGKTFELFKSDNGISVTYTNNFNSLRKRIFMFIVSMTIMIVNYLLVTYFIIITIESITIIKNDLKENEASLLTQLLLPPEPLLFTTLTIIFTLISMFSLTYGANILLTKKTMLWLVQTGNLKIKKEGNIHCI